MSERVLFGEVRPFLATSCLQGRPLFQAVNELLRLQPRGLQLTPGHILGTSVESRVCSLGVELRTHHGFSWTKRRQPVWDVSGGLQLLVESDSVHPPRQESISWAGFATWIECLDDPVTLETMYPGYHLGCGSELDWVMGRGVQLAVDVSHLHIQRTAQVLGDGVLRRLLDYDRIIEIHVSDNNGQRDQHRCLSSSSFGLEWARERAADGIPLILESYFHKISEGKRSQQMSLLLG